MLIANLRDSRMIVHMFLGEKDAALALLEQLLADPLGGVAGTHAAEAAINPLWKDLHDDPRFKAIIAKHRPKH